MSNNSAATFLSGTLITDTYSPQNGSSDSIPELSINVNGKISSALEIHSTIGGVLIPRMTTAQINMMNPDDGLMVFDTTVAAFKFRQGAAWVTYGGGGAGYSAGNPTYLQDTFEVAFGGTKNVSMGTPPAEFGTGLYIVAIGDAVLQNNTTGNNLTAVGYLALEANEDGYENTAIGYQAMAFNVSGFNNTAVGSAALLNNLASDNTAVGYVALANNLTGTRLSALGVACLSSNTTGNDNTGVGYLSLESNIIGNNCTAVGSNALANSDSDGNCAFGTGAGQDNTTGSIDAFGFQSLANNVDGFSNCAFGYQSLASNMSGSYNTAVGYTALLNSNNDGGLVAGHQLTAVGYAALYSNTIGYENTATGHAAMYYNTTGYYNSAFGLAALQNNRTGTDNCAFGYVALFGDLAADINKSSAFGSYALYSNGNQSENSAFGYHAGYLHNSGNQNSFFGAETGTSPGINNLSACSFLGYNADAAVDGLTNACAIGANSLVAVSNAIVLGNSTVPTKVGIGTNSPTNILHTVGSVQFQGISAGYTGSGLIKAQNGLSTTGAATATLDFPVPTSVPTQISVEIKIAVMDTAGTKTGYATSLTAAFWNGVSTDSTGALPAINFTTTAAFAPLAAWSISGDNLRLTVTGVAGTNTVWVVSSEIFSTTNTAA